MFFKLVEQLKHRLKEPLPGEEAQFLMAPPARRALQNVDINRYNPKKSAVMILLYPTANGTNTILIQRPVYQGVHSGQIAFPGGKFEETDIDLQQTALRETQEEIGIEPQNISIIGKLTDLYIPPSNFVVSPFIGFIDSTPNFIANTREVEKIITTDVISLGENNILEKVIASGSTGYRIKTPYYEIEGLTVWGATAMMISELNILINS